jgi:hypothetical protein
VGIFARKQLYLITGIACAVKVERCGGEESGQNITIHERHKNKEG